VGGRADGGAIIVKGYNDLLVYGMLKSEWT